MKVVILVISEIIISAISEIVILAINGNGNISNKWITISAIPWKGILKNMKKKIIPVIVAVFLILVIGAAGGIHYLLEKYSYSKERVDLEEYFQVSGEEKAVILQDEIIEEKVLFRNDKIYFDLDMVQKYFNDTFYADTTEGWLLYTTPYETVRTALGSTMQENSTAATDLGYIAAFQEEDKVYIAAEYVKQFTNYTIDVYDNWVQVYTEWGTKAVDTVKKNTQVRIKGGIKSPILCDISEGSEVEILKQMETWSKVKTEESIIGYIENKRLENGGSMEANLIQELPVADYEEPEYTSISREGKVSLGWHAIGSIEGNNTLENTVAQAPGINVIAPTWFSLSDNEGNFRSYASADYVNQAHSKGLEVWGVIDDFNYNYETNVSIDVYGIFSATTKRQRLIGNLIQAAQEYGLDGINIDFEKITSECGIHYIQFLRELSVECRKNNIILSIDNYVPFDFNSHYRLDIQGKIADYVIIMGYDEHYHGSGDPGSVASIDYVRKGLEKTIEEVPVSKVINAVPFYTILWKINGAEVTDEYLTIRNTPDFLNRLNLQPVWDEETCQNYAEWIEGDTTCRIWLEDEQSLEVKLNVMKAQNIAGVAVWRLGYGNSQVWELIQAYVRGE